MDPPVDQFVTLQLVTGQTVSRLSVLFFLLFFSNFTVKQQHSNVHSGAFLSWKFKCFRTN